MKIDAFLNGQTTKNFYTNKRQSFTQKEGNIKGTQKFNFSASKQSTSPKTGFKYLLNAIPDSYIDEAVVTAGVALASFMVHGKISKLSKLTNNIPDKPSISNPKENTEDITQKVGDIVKEQIKSLSDKVSEVVESNTKTANEMEGINARVKGVQQAVAILQKNEGVNVSPEAVNAAVSKIAVGSIINRVAPVVLNSEDIGAPNAITIQEQAYDNTHFWVASFNTERMNSKKGVEVGFKKELDKIIIEKTLGVGKTTLPPQGVTPQIHSMQVELNPFWKVGGLATIPRELAEELPKILNDEKAPRIILDSPMYLGKLKGDNCSLEEKINDDGTVSYTYVKGTDRYPLKLLRNLQIPIVNNGGGTNVHDVRIFENTMLTKPQDFNSVKNLFKGERLKEIEDILTRDGKYENESFLIKKDSETGATTYQTKVTTHLWDSSVFKINSEGDVYNNNEINAELSERFAYFNKFVYENILDIHKNGGTVNTIDGGEMRADGFILNDWHTGPMAALLRLNTVARKHYAGLDADVAERVANLPVTGFVHNATYSNTIGDSQVASRFLSILFGGFTKTLIANSLNLINDKEFNATKNPLLFSYQDEDAINGHHADFGAAPQNMLIQLSDTIVPVSSGYASEIIKGNTTTGGLARAYNLKANVNSDLLIGRVRELQEEEGREYLANISNESLQTGVVGITNGLTKANNILSPKNNAAFFEDTAKTKYGEMQAYSEELIADTTNAEDVLAWKQQNKKAAIEYMKEYMKEAKEAHAKKEQLVVDKNNKMEVEEEMLDITDISDINENTPIFMTAGRSEQQKGLEVFCESVRMLYADGSYKASENPPVFIFGMMKQGDGKYHDEVSKRILKLKQDLISKGLTKEAHRIFVSGAGSRKSPQYPAKQIATDFCVMSSNFEPCGLTHKEMMAKSGAIGIGHNVGGIASGIVNLADEGVEAKDATGLFIPYKFYEYGQKQEDMESAYNEKATELVKVFKQALEIYANKEIYAQMVKNCLKADFTATNKGGAAEQYINVLFNRHNFPLSNTVKVSENVATTTSAATQTVAPAAVQQQPQGTVPAQTASVQQQPQETVPAQTAPVQQQPQETTPAQTAPAPVQQQPQETVLAQTAPAPVQQINDSDKIEPKN